MPAPAEAIWRIFPWVHITLSNLKRFLLGTHHTVENKHLKRYVAEFNYRLNRRTMEEDLLTRLIRAPESPKLYQVSLSSGADKLTDDIGFRDICVDGTRILLNGKAVFLKGVNLHAEAPIRGGRADNDQDVATMFSYLKDLNANSVRLCHYPHDERMTRTADREGIMVSSEIPNYWGISFKKPEVYAKSATILNEMMHRDRNKASVIMWSIANETGNRPDRTKFLSDLAVQARRLDPTRLIIAALNTDTRKDGHGTLVDPLTDVLDVVGLNEYMGWYGDKPEDADTIHCTLPQKPLIMSEFGAEAKIGNHGPVTQRCTEDQQAYIYKHQLVMFAKIPQLRGTTPWVLLDFAPRPATSRSCRTGTTAKASFRKTERRSRSFSSCKRRTKTTPWVNQSNLVAINMRSAQGGASNWQCGNWLETPCR